MLKINKMQLDVVSYVINLTNIMLSENRQMQWIKFIDLE